MSQQTILALSADSAAAEQAGLSSLSPFSRYRETEELTRRDAADDVSVASGKIDVLTPASTGKNPLPVLLRRLFRHAELGKEFCCRYPSRKGMT